MAVRKYIAGINQYSREQTWLFLEPGTWPFQDLKTNNLSLMSTGFQFPENRDIVADSQVRKSVRGYMPSGSIVRTAVIAPIFASVCFLQKRSFKPETGDRRPSMTALQARPVI